MVIKLDERKVLQGLLRPQPGPKLLWHECWRTFCFQ